MATIINNPGEAREGSSGVGIVVGVLVAVILVGLFVVFGLPAIRGGTPAPSNGGVDVNVQLPAAGAEAGGGGGEAAQ